MKPSAPMIERMAEAYWNAFRDGYIAVGGRPESYPTWQQSRDPQKDETIRCLRHAVELIAVPTTEAIEATKVDERLANTDRRKFREEWRCAFHELFPDTPQPRKLRPTPTDQAFLTQTDLGKAFDA